MDDDTDDFTRQRMRVNNAPDIHFSGKLLHEYSTQSAGGTKDRWTVLRLWETRGGAWVAEQLGCSRRNGEGDLRDVLVIGAKEVRAPVEAHQSDEAYDAWRRREIMAFFGWSIVAKALAKQAGWDVVRRID